MPFLPVDTAVVVEIGPLIDDTDFKSLENSIAYNESGMSVDLLKKSSTALTKVDITPTTSSTNDWTFKGNGVYELEITAAQNDTEGSLRIVGVCDGVLPFESPVYTVVPASVYNSIVAGSDNLEVDAVQISGDSTAADNLEAILDGTGATLTLSKLRIDANDSDGAIHVTNSNGHGIHVDVAGASVNALRLDSNDGTTSDCHAIYAHGGTSGAGAKFEGGVAGHGVHAVTGTTSGYAGILAESAAGDIGYGIKAISSYGAAIYAYDSNGNGAEFVSGGSNGNGLKLQGNGTGRGIRATEIGAAFNIDGVTPAGILEVLKKFADDNGGADFDATTDSLNKIADNQPSVANIWDHVIHGTGGNEVAADEAMAEIHSYCALDASRDTGTGAITYQDPDGGNAFTLTPSTTARTRS